MSRRHDIRRVKLHLCYSAQELAELFRINIHTVRRWTRDGLQPIDRSYPYLYAGAVVAEFVRRRNKPRQPTGPGQIYCVACKSAITPAGGVVDLVPRSFTTADFVGTCPRCGRRAYQRVRLSEVDAKAGRLRVRYEDGEVPISSNGECPHTAPSDGELVG
jgi:hypothetical protein